MRTIIERLRHSVEDALNGQAVTFKALTVAADDKEVLTVEFKVNCLAPAAGEVFAARAQVKKAGRTLTVCTADAFAISDGREKVVATTLSTIMAVPITPAKKQTSAHSLALRCVPT